VPYLSNYIKMDILRFKKTKMKKAKSRSGNFEEALRRFLVAKDHCVDMSNIVRWITAHPWIKVCIHYFLTLLLRVLSFLILSFLLMSKEFGWSSSRSCWNGYGEES
jgi:hypothetical protein